MVSYTEISEKLESYFCSGPFCTRHLICIIVHGTDCIIIQAYRDYVNIKLTGGFNPFLSLFDFVFLTLAW